MLKAKLQKENQNPCFLEEAGEYLEANGYKRSEGSSLPGATYFFKKELGVVVYGDNADFIIYDEGEPDQRRECYRRYMCITDIARLDIFKWMLLFHISDTVPLQDFIKSIPAENKAISKRMWEQILRGTNNFSLKTAAAV